MQDNNLIFLFRGFYWDYYWDENHNIIKLPQSWNGKKN